MTALSLTDWITLAMLAAAAGTVALRAVNRWAVANHRDRLAMITSACANKAGQIQEALRALPPGLDAQAVKAAMVAQASKAILQEFDSTGPQVGATVEKVAGIVLGQLGALPPVPVADVVPGAAAVPAVVPAPVVDEPFVPVAADLPPLRAAV